MLQQSNDLSGSELKKQLTLYSRPLARSIFKIYIFLIGSILRQYSFQFEDDKMLNY